MNYWISALYGIIQGITEFLPVSSSGHLALLPSFIPNMHDPGVLFDLSMHLGTAFAIMLYFRDEIWEIIRNLFYFAINKKEKTTESSLNFAFNMVIATVATVLGIVVLLPFQGSFVRHPLFIAAMLFIFGALMWAADKYFKESDFSLEQKFSFKFSCLIGLAQALAIFPGVSRSGATISCARALNISRKNASAFSFLLSLPIIFAGFIFELFVNYNEPMFFNFAQMMFGLLVSFLFGILTIHYFLKVIAKLGLAPFSIYRFIVAAIIISCNI